MSSLRWREETGRSDFGRYKKRLMGSMSSWDKVYITNSTNLGYESRVRVNSRFPTYNNTNNYNNNFNINNESGDESLLVRSQHRPRSVRITRNPNHLLKLSPLVPRAGTGHLARSQYKSRSRGRTKSPSRSRNPSFQDKTLNRSFKKIKRFDLGGTMVRNMKRSRQLRDLFETVKRGTLKKKYKAGVEGKKWGGLTRPLKEKISRESGLPFKKKRDSKVLKGKGVRSKMKTRSKIKIRGKKKKGRKNKRENKIDILGLFEEVEGKKKKFSKKGFKKRGKRSASGVRMREAAVSALDGGIYSERQSKV